MPTKIARIQVTLSDESYRIVTRLAKVQGSNRSRIIAELVDDLAPVMRGLLDTMEAAAKVREENMQGVRDASYTALERLQPLLDEAEESLGLLDLMIQQSGAAEPPTSNTGVTGTHKPLKSFKTGPSAKTVKKGAK